MPTNDEARLEATKRNAVVMPFVQYGGLCEGWVSWWLRKRLKGKELLTEQRFTRVMNAENFHSEPEGRLVASDIYNYDGTLHHRDPTLAKARELQERLYGTGGDREYITRHTSGKHHGGPGRRPGTFVGRQARQAIDGDGPSRNAQNLINSLRQISRLKQAAKLSVVATTAHAIGVDCLEGNYVRYFDPNVGEFRFTNIEDLCGWWQDCYQKRDPTEPGAFGIMKYQFSVETYVRV